MANTYVFLDARRALRDKTYPLKLALRHKGATFYINLDISILEEQWKNDKIINHSNSKVFNSYISGRIAQANNIIYELKIVGSLKSMSREDLKMAIEGNSSDVTPTPTLVKNHYGHMPMDLIEPL